MTDTTQPVGGGLDIGGVLSRTFDVIGKNFVFFLLLSLVLGGLPQAVMSIATGEMTRAGNPLGVAGAMAVLMPVMVLASLVMTAAVTHAATVTLTGRRATPGEALGTAAANILPLIGIGIIAGVAIIAGLVLFIVPGIILSLAWSMAAPVQVVERAGVTASLSRSAKLTRGSRWALLGLFVVVGVINLIIGAVLGGIAGAVMALSMPPEQILYGQAVAQGLGGAVGGMIQAAVVAVAYNELRLRKEGVGAEDLASVFD